MQEDTRAVGAMSSPEPKHGTRSATPITANEIEPALRLFAQMSVARHLERVETELVQRGEAFFHVGGDGHEASAALARHLIADDYLHLHYRDKALMLARGMTPADFLHALVCTARSQSRGRQMSAHPCSPELHLLSLVGPVGNNALQAVGVAHELVARTSGERKPIVVCAMGDGTTQQGEALEAIAEAVRWRLPTLFLVHDNRLAISTHTRGRTFFDLPTGPASEFHGMPIVRLDGRDAWSCDRGFAEVVAKIRSGAGPMLVLLDVDRLTHHTNGDDERVYRSEAEREHVRRVADPIRILRERLLASGVEASRLDGFHFEAERAVRSEIDAVLATPNPETAFEARAPWTGPRTVVAPTSSASGEEMARPPVTMLEAMRSVLHDALANDPRVSLYGEDVEDPKGDVFGLTRGLGGAFPGRVVNAPLTESTIVGVSIGRALAGGRPIACIQFADFLPLAFNQIASELATLHWRTNGGFPTPVVILAPCGGYRPGLGPFHAQTFEGTFAHLPGLDVVMPSNAEDAAGLLRAVLEGGRPTLFLYPKVLLNDPSVATRADVGRSVVAPGEARIVRDGDALTFVSWGATVPLCVEAARELERSGVECAVIDLRSLSPWDEETVLRAVRKSRKLVVVHEDNLSGGFGAEVLATVCEKAGVPVEVRRVARADAHVPCNYVNQIDVLPSVRRIVEAAAPLVARVVHELPASAVSSEIFIVEAPGSSPADQNVSVVEWKARAGARIRAGEPIAECEADKAAFELCAPVGGVLEALHPEGDVVKVGTPIARIRVSDDAAAIVRRVPVEARWEVRGLGEGTHSPARSPASDARAGERSRSATESCDLVGLSDIAFVTGSMLVSNDEILARFPGRTSADVVQRTGIETRFRCGPDENALTLATRASRDALARAGLAIDDLDAILVSTSTPISVTPSLACRVQHALSPDGGSKDVQAMDVFAACSGWLYALQTAHDFCRARPDANVLVVTAEAMSHYVDPDDFDTAIVFGDAATATVVRGAAHLAECGMRLSRPFLSAHGEDGAILSLGRIEGPDRSAITPVAMNGTRVFPLAVRRMNAMLEQACREGGTTPGALDYVVPHQANARILEAARQRAKLPADRVISNVARYGNTSSSSIPIALAEMRADGRRGRVGLTAFGGGFTFGAALLEID